MLIIVFTFFFLSSSFVPSSQTHKSMAVNLFIVAALLSVRNFLPLAESAASCPPIAYFWWSYGEDCNNKYLYEFV